MRWLAEPTVPALIEALRDVAADLATLPVDMRAVVARDDPRWASNTALLGDGFVAKFAWSEPAALRIAHEAAVLGALADSNAPYLPEVVAVSTDPLLLVTREVAGSSLFAVVDSIDRDRAGAQLARFLAALHQPSARDRVEPAVRELRVPDVQADTDAIRDRLGRAGLKGGDVLAVVYKGQVEYAVFGDEGPTGSIGEASYATAKALGIDDNPKTGGTADPVTYIVFKNSVVSPIESHGNAVTSGKKLATAFVNGS